MAEIEEELNSPLIKMKEESEKAGLKLNIQKTKIMASGRITSWQIDGETMETETDFIFLGGSPKSLQMVTATMKLRLMLIGRKAMTNLDSVLKIRDITLPTKVHLVQAMVSPVVMYGCESWTIKKTSTKELMLLNYDVGEYFWESFGLRRDQTSESSRNSARIIHWKDWCWTWNSNTLATWCE